AVDGALAGNQTHRGIVDQVVTNWPPGAALWLVWEMSDPTGKAQGLAIDDLSFSASEQAGVGPLAPLSFQVSGTNFILGWSTVSGQTYQLEYKLELDAAPWTPIGSPQVGTGQPLTFTNDITSAMQRFYRLRLLP